jgi:hypothetical protein
LIVCVIKGEAGDGKAHGIDIDDVSEIFGVNRRRGLTGAGQADIIVVEVNGEVVSPGYASKSNTMITFLSDISIFSIIHILIFFVSLFAILKNNKINNPSFKMTRGAESFNGLNLMYGIASILILQIINVSEAYKNYKVLISIIDLSILLYLFYFNRWFRNKVIGVLLKAQNLKENL